MANRIYSSDWYQNKFYKYADFSSTVLDSFNAPSLWTTGITWDGSNLLSLSFWTDLIYVHSGFSSTILSSFAT